MVTEAPYGSPVIASRGFDAKESTRESLQVPVHTVYGLKNSARSLVNPSSKSQPVLNADRDRDSNLDPTMFKTTIEYILAKISLVVKESETELYTVKGKRYKQLFELMNDSKRLRDLLKKISQNLTHFVEKNRLTEIHESRKANPSSPEEKQKRLNALDIEIKMNQK